MIMRRSIIAITLASAALFALAGKGNVGVDAPLRPLHQELQPQDQLAASHWNTLCSNETGDKSAFCGYKDQLQVGFEQAVFETKEALWRCKQISIFFGNQLVSYTKKTHPKVADKVKRALCGSKLLVGYLRSDARIFWNELKASGSDAQGWMLCLSNQQEIKELADAMNQQVAVLSDKVWWFRYYCKFCAGYLRSEARIFWNELKTSWSEAYDRTTSPKQTKIADDSYKQMVIYSPRLPVPSVDFATIHLEDSAPSQLEVNLEADETCDLEADQVPTPEPVVASGSWCSRIAGFWAKSRSPNADGEQDELARKRKEFYALVERRRQELEQDREAYQAFVIAASMQGKQNLSERRVHQPAAVLPFYSVRLLLNEFLWRLKALAIVAVFVASAISCAASHLSKNGAAGTSQQVATVQATAPSSQATSGFRRGPSTGRPVAYRPAAPAVKPIGRPVAYRPDPPAAKANRRPVAYRPAPSAAKASVRPAAGRPVPFVAQANGRSVAGRPVAFVPKA